MTLEGADILVPKSNPTSHAVDMRQVHTVVEGEYPDGRLPGARPAGLLRAIASLNGIDDPLRVRPGQALLIPSAADAARNV